MISLVLKKEMVDGIVDRTKIVQIPKVILYAIFKNWVYTTKEHPQLYSFFTLDFQNSCRKQNLLLPHRMDRIKYSKVGHVFFNVAHEDCLNQYRGFLEPNFQRLFSSIVKDENRQNISDK